MSNDRFHEPVKALLQTNGEMGVNQIAKSLSVPLSTMQKYLDKDQTYFKKNRSRKWVLPEDAAKSDISEVNVNYTQVIENQIKGIESLVTTLMAQLKSTVSLIEANKVTITSVADISTKIHPRLQGLDKKATEVSELLRKNLSKVPENYRDLIKNLDLHLLIVEKGTHYMNNEITSEIASLILGQTDILSEQLVTVLKEYQKEEKS